MNRFLVIVCASLAVGLAGCGTEDASERARLELPFVSFTVQSLFFGPRTAGVDEEPFSLVITGAEHDGACKDPSALPSGTREVLVVLKPGERGWPDFPGVCAIGEDLVNCSAQVSIYEQRGKDRIGWYATSGVVIVRERRDERINVELQVDVAKSARICRGAECRCEGDVCPEASPTERLALILDAELCTAACVCTAESFKDACTCQ